MQDELEQRWQALFPQADRNTIRKEFYSLVSRYSEPHRHYHTLAHVAACLRWLDQVREAVPNPLALELALWLHDVVYNARKQDNERISAEYAVSTLSLLKVERACRDEVRQLILVTEHPSVPNTPNQAWMVDIDLAILGADETNYDAYATQVRQEYIHVPDELFAGARKVLLQAFLDAPRLYYTDYFFQQLEARARANLIRELATL